jgi:hypothetical protein
MQRKNVVVGLLAAVVLVYFALFCIPSAFAADTVRLRSLSGGEELDQTVQALELESPHGGYNTTSSKCTTCHGTDNYTDTDTALMRGSMSCAYCHLVDAPATPLSDKAKTVYGATGGTSKADFSQKRASGHALGTIHGVPASSIKLESSGVLTCSTCHLVHGTNAGAWLPDDFFDAGADDATNKVGYKYLRSNPSRSLRTTANQVPNVANRPAVDAAIDDVTVDSAVVNQFTLSIWCANCHDNAYQPVTVSQAEGEEGVSRASFSAEQVSAEDTAFADDTFVSSGEQVNVHLNKDSSSDACSRLRGWHGSSRTNGWGLCRCWTMLYLSSWWTIC